MAKRFFTSAASVLVLSAVTAHADDTGLASMHDFAKSGGRTCFATHAHSGTGTGSTKAAADAAARKSWAEFTAFEYGTDWASWGKSASKKVRYTKEARGWSSTVESRPCK